MQVLIDNGWIDVNVGDIFVNQHNRNFFVRVKELTNQKITYCRCNKQGNIISKISEPLTPQRTITEFFKVFKPF